MNTIICFTASYPYGKRETYFETELAHLASAFDKVIILPRYNPSESSKKRSVPDNVEVYLPLVAQGKKRLVQGICNSAPVKPFLSDFIKQKPYLTKANFIRWINFFLTFRRCYHVCEKLLPNYPNAILYSYWAEAPMFTTKLVRDFKKVIRMHGGDFYTERNQGYLPLRHEIYSQAQLLLPISKDIEYLLKKRYHIADSKLFLNYLGVNNQFNRFDLRVYTSSSPIVLVSCSNVVPLKRIEVIADTLKQFPETVKAIWHHFGDGTDMERLKRKIKGLPENVEVELHGWTEQKELYDFYNNNRITWFINVSRYEGLPVSIMEAFSAAIPVIATNVGGTSEIVNEENGILLQKDISNNELMNAILSCNTLNYAPKIHEAYTTWEKQYNAQTNYSSLIGKMKQL